MTFRKALLLGVVVVMAGWVGFWLGEQRARLVFVNWKPALVVNKLPAMSGKPGEEVDFGQFWTVWDKVSSTYVDKDKIDSRKMVDGAISGMVAALGDPYTAFLPAQQNRESKEDLGGAFEGVGIQLGFEEERLVVVAPLDGTPAKKAGVKAGDFILHIRDGKKGVDQDTDGMALPEAVRLIRGPKGSEVVLTMFRKGMEKPFEVTLSRDTIVVKSVAFEFLEREGEKFAWVRLSRFGDRTQDEWTEAVEAVRNQGSGVRGIVLDLRNNPGGYLDGAVYTAGEFLPAGRVVVAQQYGDGSKAESKVARNGRLLKSPMVVLVNKGSASAAEILAGALQDYRRARVVGEQSFGKGSVQQPEDFADGSGVHITIARWLRPSGISLDKKGITPDVEVKWENGEIDGQWEKDPQLVKAMETL